LCAVLPHQDATPKNKIFFVFGSILAFILVTPIHEYANGVPGMLAVGLIFLILLVFWTYRSLKKQYKLGGVR
jgi:hypothetical protein